jgi:hypothetical protein
MHTLTLFPAALPLLVEQVTKNNTVIYPLRDDTGLIRVMAFVTFEQCAAAVQVRVEMGDSVNSITLERRDDIAARVARFIEELANGVTPSSVPEVDEHLLVSDLESALRDALRLGQGTHYLPADELDDLCLLLKPAGIDPTRTAFRLEMNGTSLTLPLLLPADREQAYALLVGCVQELIANYRNVA